VAVKGFPVVIVENGIGIPVKPVDGNAPVMTVAENGLGLPVTISDNGAPFVLEEPSPPVPPVPGPLDYIETGEGLDSITVEYDLARDVAMLGVAFRHTGPVTTLTATHGGEPLELVSFVLHPTNNIGAASFIGNGLTIEPADLVITPVGGTIGPALLRIDDSFAIDEIAVGVFGERTGASNNQNGAPPIVFDPVSGNGYGVWALATASAETEATTIPWNGSSPLEPLFWGVASSGTLLDAPDFVLPTEGWTQDGDGWYIHTGAATYLNGEPLADMITVPHWWEVEIDVPAGSRLWVQTMLYQSSYISTLYNGPFSGVVRGYRNQTAPLVSSFRIYAQYDAKFRNLKYCDTGMTVYGQFGRSVNTVPNGSSVQFMMKSNNYFAGVAMEVHEA
jgi:hypothetical protein